MCGEWGCGNCTSIFDEPGEDRLRRSVCPECGSLEIWYLSDYSDVPDTDDDLEDPDGA